MNFSFYMKDASLGFHIYQNSTWENVNIGHEISVQLETNKDSKKFDPYSCAVKRIVSEKLETVGHIQREVSRHTYFTLKKKEDAYMALFCQHAIIPALTRPWRWT